MHRGVTVINPFLRSTPARAVSKRVLQHDLDMYAAIRGQAAALPPAGTELAPSPIIVRRAKRWSPSVLAAYLGHLNMPRIAVRVVRPEVTDWMRRLSNSALERLQQAQERLASAKAPRRDPPNSSSRN